MFLHLYSADWHKLRLTDKTEGQLKLAVAVYWDVQLIEKCLSSFWRRRLTDRQLADELRIRSAFSCFNSCPGINCNTVYTINIAEKIFWIRRFRTSRQVFGDENHVLTYFCAYRNSKRQVFSAEMWSCGDLEFRNERTQLKMALC